MTQSKRAATAPTSITGATLAPIGSIVVIVGAAWFLQGSLLKLSYTMDQVVRNVEQISSRLDNFVTTDIAESWIKRFRAENPNVKVPDLR